MRLLGEAMCTKILLEQLEKLPWNGRNSLEDSEWSLKFHEENWTKGLAVRLVLKRGLEKISERKIVLRRGQDSKLIRNLLQLWVTRLGDRKSGWIAKRGFEGARIGPNVQRFVQAVMARYMDGGDVFRQRALDNLRSAVRRAQDAGLTEEDLKIAWDEGLFRQMLAC